MAMGLEGIEKRLNDIEHAVNVCRGELKEARNLEKTLLFTQRYASPSKKLDPIQKAIPKHVEHGNRPTEWPAKSCTSFAEPYGADKGHSAQHHGLQKHSLGDIYPWAIVGIEDNAVTHYELHNLITGAKVVRQFYDAQLVMQFHGTHGAACAYRCMKTIQSRGADPLLGAFISTPGSSR
jgi:hypothetical protein